MRFQRSFVCGLAIASLYGLSALAQPTGPAPAQGGAQNNERKVLSPLPPRPADAEAPSSDPKNLQGVWLTAARGAGGGGPPGGGAPGGGAPGGGAPGAGSSDNLTPEAKKKQEYSQEMTRKGTPLASDAARCRPMNNIGIGSTLFPAEIVQSPREIVVMQEEGRTRWIIHLDRDHPKDLKPSFWGDSVGHWEGNTLVVDTIGFSGQAENTTTTTHIVSRLQKLDGGEKLELKVTTEDPQIYLTPATRTSTYSWHPELQLLEFQCEENPVGAMEGLTAK